MSISVMTLVWRYAPYSGRTLLALLALADWSNDEGSSWPSLAKLAKKSRQSERNIRYSLRKLERDEVLSIRHRHETSSVYLINLNKLASFEVHAVIYGPCWYCGDKNAGTVDHQIPLVKGGKEKGNLVPACSKCNCSKGKSTVEEFRARRGGIKFFGELYPQFFEGANFAPAKTSRTRGQKTAEYKPEIAPNTSLEPSVKATRRILANPNPKCATCYDTGKIRVMSKGQPDEIENCPCVGAP